MRQATQSFGQAAAARIRYIFRPREIIFRSDIGDAEKIAARTKEYEDRFLSPFIAAERGYLDDVIMPHSTRRRIARALAMLKDKKVEIPAKKHDNLPL